MKPKNKKYHFEAIYFKTLLHINHEYKGENMSNY